MEFNGTFFATIITFIIFVFVMNKVLYEPMRKIVNARREFIDGNYSDAAECDKKAEDLNKNRDEKIVEAKDDARKQYNELLNDFKAERSEKVKSAQENSAKELEEEYSKLSNISNEAKERLKGSMNDLANDIVEKVIGYRSEIQGFDDNKINEILYR